MNATIGDLHYGKMMRTSKEILQKFNDDKLTTAEVVFILSDLVRSISGMMIAEDEVKDGEEVHGYRKQV